MIPCPSCGFAAPDDFAFCPKCGTRLEGRSSALAPGFAADRPLPTQPALTEERKVVTTLFCDLVGFTALSEAHDHENVDALLRRYATHARGIVEAHGGVVEKFIGDAVVAVFGFPRAHDDDPERAVRAGLKIAAEVPRLQWPGDAPLAVRVGINSGETFVHTDVDPASGETFFTGDAVNTAARLQSAAPPGGVVVGELTRSLIAKTFLTQPLGPLTLKGKAAAVPAWRVTEPIAHTGLRTSGESATPFFGRQRELKRLRAALRSTVESTTAQFVLLVGEPGIGKSRLVLEFAKSLGSAPDSVTWRQGRCLAYGDASGFAALSDILKAHAGILDSDDVATVEAKLEAILPEGEDKPWLRHRLRPLLGLRASDVSQQESFAAWARFLELVAAGRPCVVVVEDLHWADAQMLAFVHYLQNGRLDAPMVVIATTRPELLERHPDLTESWPSAACITLRSLSRGGALGLAAQLLGGPPTAETAESIIARAGGNPLYLEEHVRLLVERDLVASTPRGVEIKQASDMLPFPNSLQGVIGARIDLLSPRQREALAAAAVLGESFWGGGIAALGGLDQAEISDAMKELVAKHLVRPALQSSFAGELEYMFWHALVRDVVYARLPRKVRAAKHAAAARWVEQIAGGRARELAEVLAYHYATAFELASSLRAAAATDLCEPARSYLALAGEKAEHLDAAAAEGYYTRALAITPDPTAERFRLLARRAAIAGLCGRLPEAVTDLRAASSGLLKAGDSRAAAAAMTDLSDVMDTLGDLQCREVFSAAVELIADDSPSPEMVRVLLAESAMVLEEEGPRQGLERIERVMEIAESLGLPAPVDALDLRGRARCALGDGEGLADLRKAIEAAEREGRRVDQAGLLGELAWCLVSFEGPLASLGALETAAELWERQRVGGMVTSTRSMAVRSLYWAGEWDRALSECAELAPIEEESGDAWGLAIVRYVWSLLLLGRGDVGRAGPLAAQALEVARNNPLRGVSAVYLVAAAAARQAVGDNEAAFALLEECRDVLSGKGDTVFVYLLPLAVRTAVEAANADLARSFSDLVVPVLPFGRHVDVTLRAQVAELDGKHQQAAATYADAACRWHDFGTPYEEAYALLGQGRCLMALGRAEDAREPLSAGCDIFERLGAKPALAEVEALLSQLPTGSTV